MNRPAAFPFILQEIAMAKYIVARGEVYYDGMRLNEAGAMVEVDDKKMKPGPNLRKATDEEVKAWEANQVDQPDLPMPAA